MTTGFELEAPGRTQEEDGADNDAISCWNVDNRREPRNCDISHALQTDDSAEFHSEFQSVCVERSDGVCSVGVC